MKHTIAEGNLQEKLGFASYAADMTTERWQQDQSAFQRYGCCLLLPSQRWQSPSVVGPNMSHHCGSRNPSGFADPKIGNWELRVKARKFDLSSQKHM